MRATVTLVFVAALAATAATGVAVALQPAGAPTLDVRARALRPGEVLRVEWSTLDAVADSGATVRAFGRSAPAYRLGNGRTQALVGIDLDQAPGEYQVALVSATGQVLTASRVTIEPARFTTRTLTVDPGFVNPPKAVLPRIQRESALLADAFARPAPERLWRAPVTRPVPQASNSRFGSRSVFNGEIRNPHTGADFLSPAGTPILAPLAGRVVVAQDLYFSGGSVVIDHGLGLFSQFAHMSRIDATVGQMVAAGDVVGLVGATGRVTGAHLHWGMRLGGARVDPLALMDVLK
jgi:murein DD-endopeptidase MepM/ murein hydrolase activator NlpD